MSGVQDPPVLTCEHGSQEIPGHQLPKHLWILPWNFYRLTHCSSWIHPARCRILRHHQMLQAKLPSSHSQLQTSVCPRTMQVSGLYDF